MKRIDVLENAQDLTIIEEAGINKWTYAAKPSLDVMRQFYNESISNSNDKNIDVFKRHWKFDEKEGIMGSSTFLALRLDKEALRPRGLWLPGLLEGKVLDLQKKLSNGVYRDCGVIVYNAENSNSEIARSLVSQAESLGLKLPLIVPFGALDYIPQGKEVRLFLVDFATPSEKVIIQGKEAQKRINSLEYKGNSGVQRLLRVKGGNWYAAWNYLDFSDDGGRVDWVCGEAETNKLITSFNHIVNKRYSKEINKLREKQKSETDEFWKLLHK